MAVEIKMPQLSDTMHAGKILLWNKKEGDEIKRGDILAEVETDKANLEIESFHQGTLLKILIPAAQDAKVGEVIAIIGQAGEAIGPKSEAAQIGNGIPAVANLTSTTPTAVSPVDVAFPVNGSEPKHSENVDRQGERIKASPLARKLAEQRQIDLTAVHGTGPMGRIVRRDIEEAKSSGPQETPKPTPAPEQPVAVASDLPGTLTPLSKMRETIARRMQESVTQAPHFYTTTSIDMGGATKLRESLKEVAEYKGISVNHLIIKAAAYALKKEPRVNRAIRQGMVYTPNSINIGIITSVEDGLLIPVIKDADTLPLRDIVFEARAAVDRARAGRPNSSDLAGGTFSISNMGMFDVESFTAIINPGQGAILAVSSIKEEPVVRDRQIVIGSIMKVTLSVDHRIIDGVMAGNFLKHFKEALEVPGLLMV